MKAILLTTILVDVESEDAAATLAIRMDQEMRHNFKAALDEHGITEEEAAGEFATLGVQVMMMPEAFAT